MNAKAKQGHDNMVLALADAIRSCDVECTADLKQVPSHRYTQRRGDLYLTGLKLAKTGYPVIADVSICHPVSGEGQWKDNAILNTVRNKLNKHQTDYAGQGIHFVAWVANSFGVLHEDLLRTLWLVAAQTREDSHNRGETSALSPAARDYSQSIFARLRARASFAVARHTAMRLDTYAPWPTRVYGHTAYVPTDPHFAASYANVLTGIPIAPSFSTGG